MVRCYRPPCGCTRDELSTKSRRRDHRWGCHGQCDRLLPLTKRPVFGGSVAVIERDPTYAHASSALSASSIRQQFSTPENIRMSRFGIEFIREIDRHLGLGDGAVVDIGLDEGGYLYLATSAFEGSGRNHAVQVAEGADTVLLSPRQILIAFPGCRPRMSRWGPRALG